MRIDKLPQINPSYTINKTEIQNTLQPKTYKEDYKQGNTLYPLISVDLCDNLILQNVLLKTSLEILAEDTTYNDIVLKNKNIEPNTISEEVLEFWNNNQDELCNEILDYYSYGFAGAEIVLNNKGEPAKLYQIPANTLSIRKETKRNNETGEQINSYYAIQSITGANDIKMRLAHHQYDEADQELPICLWFGGGRKSEFYDYPMWISAFNNVSASVTLDMLDAQKLADGNLISGVLTIIRPPQPINENIDGETVEDTLEEKMEAKGSGVYTLELVTRNPNIPLTVDYVQISESNYGYLSELSQKCDDKILAVLKVPKARLLIDDTTESMNSQKTNTLYKIYTRELENRQRVFENIINEFNINYFDFYENINITTPVFVDEKEIETENLIKLFNTGLITLGQAINKAGTLYTEYEIEIDDNNPIYNERYYNGNPLGFADAGLENPLDNVGDLIDYFKIN